ncbi:Ig-like domain-containing protein [Deinococcus aquaedulcis]|uniref:Ig-like domain-containing protein n=1 Tax=Deinococcus aquaedulcis TaxID=2840455 RepID=UPI001C82D766|nr:Ig-like domain-containing protein [Deinococcus aquaedulcis]
MAVRWLLPLLTGLLLSSCGDGGPPPSVTLITPANDAVLSGTSAIQATLDDDVKGEVRVYARKRDSKENGVLIGSANTRPYIVRWNTAPYPVGSELEIYAKAFVGGAEGESTPVRVTLQNATAPTLEYLVAYNLPANVTGQSLGQKGPGALIDPRQIHAAHTAAPAPVAAPTLRAQATPGRALWAEWSWKPVDGAAGYRIMLSKKSIAGPYEVRKNQAASAGSIASERYSEQLEGSDIGERVYGAVRSLGATNTESATSNAGTGVFLDAQQVASPAQNQTIADGRPILTWSRLQGVSGYLFFLCDRPCTQDSAVTKWTNFPKNMTSELSAVYPASSDKLAPGTYYWWVAGVRMEGGKAVSLSYSEQRRLVVP